MTAGEAESPLSLLIATSAAASTEQTATARCEELLVDGRGSGRLQCMRVAPERALSATDALTKLLTQRPFGSRAVALATGTLLRRSDAPGKMYRTDRNTTC